MSGMESLTEPVLGETHSCKSNLNLTQTKHNVVSIPFYVYSINEYITRKALGGRTPPPSKSFYHI